MALREDIAEIHSIFIDTAPFIYFVEGHSELGQRVKAIFDYFHLNELQIYSSVITLTEVVSKPVQVGNKGLVEQFVRLLKNRKNFCLLEISREIAIKAGELRGCYPFLKSMDALQIAAAMEKKVDIFFTNDLRLKQIKDINIWTMEDVK
jgi:predicted nucleic acid-binding protein